MEDFKVGDVVICIDDQGFDCLYKGEEYVVGTVWPSNNTITITVSPKEQCDVSRFKLKQEDTVIFSTGAGLVVSTGDWFVSDGSDPTLLTTPIKVVADMGVDFRVHCGGFYEVVGGQALTFPIKGCYKVVKGEQRNTHGDLMKAWAEGFDIQVYDTTLGLFGDIEDPYWHTNCTYRIKPTEGEETPQQRKIQEIEEKQIALAGELKALREEL
jgi:hypothetical protein